MDTVQWDGTTERRTHNIDLPAIIDTAQQGASVLDGLLRFISNIAHTVGHVNHPLLIDKIEEALSHITNLGDALHSLGNLAKSGGNAPPPPDAGTTP